MDKAAIINVLGTVIHPASGKDIVALDIVQDIVIEGDNIKFKLIFPQRDPMASSLKKACREALSQRFPTAQVSILELVSEKKIKKSTNINDLGLEELENVGKMIAIASGKGGVGKSTVAVNLAITLAKQGYKVGLADADIYGPSVPKMTGTEGIAPEVVGEEGSELMIPVEKFGVKWMSIGYFARPEQALVWRGPMACNALKQMILQVKWGELDYLLIDLPPRTGDKHISIVSDLPLDGAIIVSTPQAVALADVEKGINMFRNPQINKKIYGIIENMAWFTPAELPNNRYYIFGKNGCETMAKKYDVPLLCQIPLVQSVREDGDNGTPQGITSLQDTDIAAWFE